MTDMFTSSIHKIQHPDMLASQARRKPERPTPDNPLIVSASELATFLRCRVQHHWSYQCKLEPISTRVPLVMGKLGHRIFDEYYQLPSAGRNERSMERIAQRLIKKTSVKELPLEDKNLLRAMTIGYSKWANSKKTEYGDRVIGIKKCFPEDAFLLPLVKDKSILVRGYIDVRFKPELYKHTLAALESKFKKSIQMNDVENKLQLSVYLWAMMEKWPKFKRYQVYYQILRKQMPGPRVKAALFYREPVERDTDEIRQWAIDAGRQAQDMLDAAVYPNPMDSCSYSCDFKVPCLLRGAARDLKSVLKEGFQKRSYAK